MPYFYQVFGLTCRSEIAIPSFYPIQEEQVTEVDFEVKLGKVDRVFEQEPSESGEYTQMNAREFFLEVPEVARYFVKNGNTVTIEPISEDMRDVLLYFKSNGMAAILFQRNKIPFHVSGVIDYDGGVWLFSAESGIGKSSTALKLKELGYPIFTDDTALIYVENGTCYAKASYPMIKAWPGTVANQKAFDESASFPILKDWEKMGIYFHDGFVTQAKEVKGITFLKVEGDEIHIRKLSPIEGMIQLLPNVYRGEWVTALNQNEEQFFTVSQIAQTVPFFEASRPKDLPTYCDFSKAIEEKILQAETERQDWAKAN